MSDDAAFVRDRLDITNLIHRYAHHADSGDHAGFASLFRDDARIDIGFPGVTDKASLLRMMKERPQEPNPPKTRHVMTNLVFDSQTAREASGALYFTLMSTASNKLTAVVTGQYTFTATKQANDWRIGNWKAAMDAKLF